MAPERDHSGERPREDGGLGSELAARVEAIVHAAEREARNAERAIAERRRSAEDEVARYVASARLHADAEAAARAARLEVLGGAARRLVDELTDATDALTDELRRGEDELRDALPRTPWPATAPAQDARAPFAAAPDGPAEAERAPFAAEPDGPAEAERAPFATAPDGVASAVPHEHAHATWSRADGPPAPDPAFAPAAAAAAADVPNAARLVAIEMAVGGAPRAEVDTHLRTRFGMADPAALLDDVFGTESHATSRLAWGEP